MCVGAALLIHGVRDKCLCVIKQFFLRISSSSALLSYSTDIWFISVARYFRLLLINANANTAQIACITRQAKTSPSPPRKILWILWTRRVVPASRRVDAHLMCETTWRDVTRRDATHAPRFNVQWTHLASSPRFMAASLNSNATNRLNYIQPKNNKAENVPHSHTSIIEICRTVAFRVKCDAAIGTK